MQDAIENVRGAHFHALRTTAAVAGASLVLALAARTREQQRNQALRSSPSDDLDLIDGYGGDDVIHGYGSDDRISGGSGDDHLIGDRGDDQLNGGPGNDRLIGGEGDDTLVGAEGDDILEGGSGDDTYVFAASFGHDVVRERARDRPGREVLAFEQLTRENARLERDDGDLIVLDRRSDDSVRIEGFAAYHKPDSAHDPANTARSRQIFYSPPLSTNALDGPGWTSYLAVSPTSVGDDLVDPLDYSREIVF
jgi:hypothetical protein